MEKYCFVKNTFFNEPEDLHELERGFARRENVKIVLGSPSYSTRYARGEASFAHDVFCRENVEKAVKILSGVIAFGAHGPIFCSELFSSIEKRAPVYKCRR